ncbi:MAG: pyruvate formate lyase-activating protein [Ruminococcaceae bacterium]|nr:pyruvate formate lyase-activating protein [Oscillospiraceae bacterium]
MIGYVHSVESFGTVDGPGIRMVVFLQGCPMRCLYCHNPDTWDVKKGTPTKASELIERYRKNKAFYSKGGLTVTGGEPLVQLPFLTELFVLAKENGIHTCLDTAAATYLPDNAEQAQLLDRLLEHTDLVMLDIKQIDPDKHRHLTGMDNARVLAFARLLDRKGIPMWIRHTVVEGYTDDPADLTALGEFIGSLRYVKALDVLPYHTMGVGKYKELGTAYPLDGVPPLSKDAAATARDCILAGIRKVRDIPET